MPDHWLNVAPEELSLFMGEEGRHGRQDPTTEWAAAWEPNVWRWPGIVPRQLPPGLQGEHVPYRSAAGLCGLGSPAQSPVGSGAGVLQWGHCGGGKSKSGASGSVMRPSEMLFQNTCNSNYDRRRFYD